VSAAVGFAFLAGAAGVVGTFELLGRAPGWLSRRGPAFVRGVVSLAEVLMRLGREGREPGAVERRRLLLAGAVVAFLVGVALAGPLPGLGLAAGGPWVVSRALRARRERYRRSVDEAAPQLAVAIADAIGGGHSLRAAVEEAAGSVHGAAGHELRRGAAELAAGATTDSALESMRVRARSHRFDGGTGAARGRGASGDGSSAVHRVAGGAAASRRRTPRGAREPRLVRRPLELVPDRVAGGDRLDPSARRGGGDAKTRARSLVSVAPFSGLAAAASRRGLERVRC
jgi:tight adherence protein B